MEGRDERNGRFLPGNKCSPGRGQGSRNKLGHAFVVALQEDFEMHGQEAIAKVRADKPHEYLKVIASTLPKILQRTNELDEVADDEILDLIGNIRAAKARRDGNAAVGDAEAENDPSASRH